MESKWPDTKELLYEELAKKVLEFCEELNQRQQNIRHRNLRAAKEIWPVLKAALDRSERKVGLNNQAEPILPEWAEEPVVSLSSSPYKVKNKHEANVVALTTGDGRWATIGELWLWVGGGGPIVTRTLEMYGYLKKKTKS